MIEIEKVHKVLGGRVVLSAVDLRIDTGEVVALVGPSGTGKSVLLKLVVGLLVPDAGEIRIGGHSIVHASYRELGALRRRIGFVFQDGALLDSLTVRENLRLALDDRECARSPIYAADRIEYALAMVHLPGRVMNQLPDELSGGMRKRVGVARALINTPDILLYDEPTTGLDPQSVGAINELIVRSRDALGATSVVVTHDMGSLPAVADRVAFLDEGMLRFTGSPAEFLSSTDPRIAAFLHGDDAAVKAVSAPLKETEVAG